MIKINNTGVTISLLILICMSILCHLSNYFYPKNDGNDKFNDTSNYQKSIGLDPNTLYTMGHNSCLVTPNFEHSRHFREENKQDECPIIHKDPCNDVLKEPHFQIPEDVSNKCDQTMGGEDGENKTRELSEEDYKKLLKIYAMNKSRRLSTYPWFS